MSESIAEGLSVVGLVVGFPLLLLGLMLSLEKLESWGLRSTEAERAAAPAPDRIADAAEPIEQIEQIEQVSVATPDTEQAPAAGGRSRGGP